MRKIIFLLLILLPMATLGQNRANNRNITINQLITDLQANNWKLFYSDGSGNIIELALGADGTVLTSNGASSAPTFKAGSSVTQLSELSDVTSAAQTAGYVIISDGGNYYGRALTENDISDLQSYLTTEVDGSVSNELQTLVGDITSTGTTTLTTTIGDDKILEKHLKSVNSPTDEYFLTYEATTGDFEWQDLPGTFHDPVTLGTANGLSLSTQEISLQLASGSTTGALSQSDWNEFNNKADQFSTGNLTESTSSILTITGGTGSVIGSGTSIQVSQATGSTSGYLSTVDWNTFNNKVSNATHSGDVSGSTTLTIGADKVLESHLKAVNSPTDEYYLTYEATTGDFEWQDITAGDVTGPGSSTDNALVRFNGTGGTSIQNSGVTLSDLGDMTFTAGDKIYLASNGYNYLMDNGGNMQLRNSQVGGRINFLVGAATSMFVDYDGIDVTGEVDISGISEPADGGDGILYHNSSDNKLYWKYNTSVYDLTQSGGGADELVKVDASATADYIGATGSSGVLRSGSGITYTDGGSFVTLSHTSHTGDVTGSAALTIASNAVEESMLHADNSPTDEYALTYESSTGNFEWQEMSTGGGGVGSASSTELLWNNSGSVDGTANLVWSDTYSRLTVGDNGMLGFGSSADIRFDFDGTANALEIYDSGLGSFMHLVNSTPNIIRVRDNVIFSLGNDDDFQFSTSGSSMSINNTSDVNIANLSYTGAMWFAGYLTADGWIGSAGQSTPPTNVSGTYQIWFDTDTDIMYFVDDDGDLHQLAEDPAPGPAPSPRPTIPGIDSEEIYGLTTQMKIIEYSPDNTKYRTSTIYYQDGALVYSKPDPWKRLGIIRKLLLK